MTRDYLQLQNGSDIRGIAMPGIEGQEVNIDKEVTANIAKAFAAWLRKKLGKEVVSIAVGRDSRLSGEELENVFEEALKSVGVPTLRCGLASTPAMFMSTKYADSECDGAVMITASHLPWNRNGFKFFTGEGGVEKEDITEILRLAENCEDGRDCDGPLADIYDFYLMEEYATCMRRIIIDGVDAADREHPLKGMHIVVDAGNGAGGFFAKNILAELGADISGSQFLEPDGHFPNHEPNPENKEAMKSIASAVVKSGADLGLIFDTDVDRVAAVDASGTEIARNGIVALAATLVSENYPGSTVVTDSVTSDGLTYFIEQKLGMKHLRFKRGYRNVINKGIELNGSGIPCGLAIETSGHAAFKENYFLDDGAYLATKIVIKAAKLKEEGRTIADLIAELPKPKEELEVRFPLGEDYKERGTKILVDFEEFAKSERAKLLGISLANPNFEGIRVNVDRPGLKGWALLRKSLHDPILPFNCEVTEGSCTEILEIVKEFIDG